MLEAGISFSRAKCRPGGARSRAWNPTADIRIAAQHLETFEYERHAFRAQRRIGVGDMEMQVRAGGVAGEAERGDHFAALARAGRFTRRLPGLRCS